MMIPTDIWLTVVSYRDFYDLPRLIFIADEDLRYWILDNSFDDELDDYSSIYSVYFAGSQPEQAYAAFELHAGGEKGGVVEVVPTSHLKFDPTKRLTHKPVI
jgi:hypothetical protein